MNKPFLLLFTVCGIAVCSALDQARAAGPPVLPDGIQPIQVIVAFADGRRKVRVSHDGRLSSVAIPGSEQVTVTVRFPPGWAGTPAMVDSLDGGELTMPDVRKVSTDNTLTFQFRAGSATGSYRLLITSVYQYDVTFYVYNAGDQNRPGQTR